MILSLSQAPTKPFEVYNWHKTEFEAINGYLETLPQFSIRDFLLQSWESIESYYYDEKYPNFGVRRSSAPYQESTTSIDSESSQHSHISTLNFGTCNEKETDKAPENVATNWKSRQREGSQQNRHLAQPDEYLPQRVLSHSHLIFPETTAQTAEMRSLNGHQQSDSLKIPSANAPNYVLADQEHDNPTMELEKNAVDGMLRSQQPDHALLPVNSDMVPRNIFNAAQLGLPMSLENLDFSQDTFNSQQPGHALLPVNSDMIPNIFNAAQLGLPMSLENLDFSQDTFDSQQPDHALFPVNSDMIPRNIFNAAQFGLPMSLENSSFSQDTSSLLAQFVAQNMNDL
ncbi:hypothetical protein N7536_000097 [Penicillium majusculum]|nr:hypothetical protein N7536_000097 [Penicillium majusculum]